MFSTAPADEAFAALKDRLPAIQHELGVTRLVSKWDEAALKGVPASSRVEATDRLAREFNPGPKQLQAIEQVKKAKPVPLAEATRKFKDGKF